MPLTRVRVGYDAEEYGTVTLDGDALAFAGPNVDAVRDHVRFVAEKLGRQARDDKELSRIKPAAVLAAMVEGDQGRLWAMEADDDGAGEPVETPDGTDPPTEEPTENEWATDPATGLLVRNVFCATGPGGGTDPTCKPGRTAAQTAFLTNHPDFAPLYDLSGKAREVADLALYDAAPAHPDFGVNGTMTGLAYPPTDPLDKPHRVRVLLARRIHELDREGLLNDADRSQLDSLMTALGVRTVGTRGEVTRFDPEFHVLPAGVGAPTGATVRVLRPGYTGLYGSKTVGHDTTGDNWLRAEVELL